MFLLMCVKKQTGFRQTGEQASETAAKTDDMSLSALCGLEFNTYAIQCLECLSSILAVTAVPDSAHMLYCGTCLQSLDSSFTCCPCVGRQMSGDSHSAWI